MLLYQQKLFSKNCCWFIWYSKHFPVKCLLKRLFLTSHPSSSVIIQTLLLDPHDSLPVVDSPSFLLSLHLFSLSGSEPYFITANLVISLLFLKPFNNFPWLLNTWTSLNHTQKALLQVYLLPIFPVIFYTLATLPSSDSLLPPPRSLVQVFFQSGKLFSQVSVFTYRVSDVFFGSN